MNITDQTVRWWNLTIELKEFPELLRNFVRINPDTQRIEEMGTQLAEHAFSIDELCNFIRAVCAWGGYPGIANRVINNNQPNEIAAAFQKAYQMAIGGQVIDALALLRQLHNLGGVSFASKHLKFLAPNDAVVLDSIIEDQLGYARNTAGYAAFLTDCRDILNACNGIRYTGCTRTMAG
jgi:hypothetical protein